MLILIPILSHEYLGLSIYIACASIGQAQWRKQRHPLLGPPKACQGAYLILCSTAAVLPTILLIPILTLILIVVLVLIIHSLSLTHALIQLTQLAHALTPSLPTSLTHSILSHLSALHPIPSISPPSYPTYQPSILSHLSALHPIPSISPPSYPTYQPSILSHLSALTHSHCSLTPSLSSLSHSLTLSL